MPLEPATAKNIVGQAASKDLRRILLMGLLGGASARAASGIYGNMSRNLRRRRAREDDEAVRTNEITLPVQKQSAAPPRPDWFVPASVLGGAGAVYGGWAGVGRLMKAYRKMRTRQELDKAKQEFTDALSQESGLKMSADLDALATAWVNGELDEDLEKAAGLLDHAIAGVKGVPSAFYTAAALLAGTGGLAGWKMVGNSPKDEEIRAYREASRRRRAGRPVSLKVKTVPSLPSPKQDSTSRPEVKEPYDSDNDKEASPRMFKRAVNWGRVASGLGRVGLGAAGGIGGSYLATKTDIGKKYLGNRAHDLMSDPRFVDEQVQALMSNPAVLSSFYDKMLPAIKQQMVSRNPLLGRLAQHFA